MTKGISVIIILLGTWTIVFQAGFKRGREHAIRQAISEGALDLHDESGEITHCLVKGTKR